MSSAAPLPAPPAGSANPSFWTKLRATLLAGLVIFLPAAITIWVCILVDSPFRRPFGAVADLLGRATGVGLIFARLAAVPGLGLTFAFLLILLIGLLARNYLGNHFIRLADELAHKIPVIRGIYSSVKQVSDTVFTSAGKQAFRQAVLVRFPTAEAHAIGFVTGEAARAGPEAGGEHEKLLNVFVPTAPNPTSGFLLMIPESRLVPANMSVEAAFKMVVSGGVVMPAAPAAPPPAAPEALKD